ncbi:MAG: hypothetical protein HC902_03270 [Calothrix sp. SM1_5_4]|nr:hypothetical protein [Calothrix sp. SM1_5_4]
MPGKNKPLRRGPILDPIHPRDFRELTIIYACEQCSHFAPETKSCTIGYDASKHLKVVQDHNYELYGRVAFCRFSEID